MYSLSISIHDDATPFLRSLVAAVHKDKLRPIIGRAGVNTVRGHLFGLDRERANDMGGRRTHFYAEAARSTNFQTSDTGVILSINKTGIAQRLHGGRIEPVNAKYLTIPARSEAYGKRAKEFSNLGVIFGRGGRPIGLAEQESVDISVRSRKTKKGTKLKTVAKGERGGGLMYWLVPYVDQQADPTVLPTGEALLAGVMPRVDSYIGRIFGETQNG